METIIDIAASIVAIIIKVIVKVVDLAVYIALFVLFGWRIGLLRLAYRLIFDRD